MRSSDDIIDVRLRITRAENPFLFKALAELGSGPGVGLRSGFIKQLAEVGLMVHDERMRREPGVSSRTAGGLVAALSDHLSGAGPEGATSNSAPPGPAVSVMPTAQSAPAGLASGAGPAEPAPALLNQSVGASVDAPLPRDDMRSPSRVAGAGPRRLLGGYAND